MIPRSLQRLEETQHALIAALDAQDVEALEAATAAFRGAVDSVRAIGGWREHPEIVERVARLQALAEAAGIRVNFLTDANRQRIEALGALRGNAGGGAYRRDGSRAA